MRWLDQLDNIGLFHIKFLLDLTRYMGFYPNLSENKAPYFDLQEGCMSHHKPKHPFIEGTTKDLWVLLLGTDFDKLQSRLQRKYPERNERQNLCQTRTRRPIGRR